MCSVTITITYDGTLVSVEDKQVSWGMHLSLYAEKEASVTVDTDTHCFPNCCHYFVFLCKC